MAKKMVTPKRAHRPAPAPIVLVKKKKSGVGGGILLVLLLLLGAGAYFVHYNKQQNEAALAAKEERLEQNALNRAETERLRAEREAEKEAMREARRKSRATAMGSTRTATNDAADEDDSEEEEEEEGTVTAMGSTVKPKAGTGIYAPEATETEDESTEEAVYDLTAKGEDAKDVAQALKRAMKKAIEDGSYSDLLSDLQVSLNVVQPDSFGGNADLPALPGKDDKLKMVAQSICVSLMLASDIEFDASGVDPDKHAEFQSWLLEDKAKVSLAFAQALDQNSVTNRGTAVKMMSQLREAWMKDSDKAMKKIKSITKKKK